MRDLFERISESNDKFETHVELSFIELYKENIRDLLSDNFPAMPTGGLKLLENEKDRVTIADVAIKSPKTADEVMELVLLGNERRSTSFTTANSVSSRSHAVLQVNITRKSRRADVDMDREAVYQDTTSATLSIVDLAGSERASATRNMGERMKEGAQINKSLLALSSCINALCMAQRRGARPHVPYRNSKLTRLLKFSLGGNCRTVMIVCVSPSSKDLEDTSNTLTWADRAKNVKTSVSRNVGGTHVSARQYMQRIQELSERNKLLEAQLLSKDQESNQLQTMNLKDNQRRVAALLAASEAQINEALDAIKEGAEQRARWDVAELGISSLTSRRDEIDDDDLAINPEREKKTCDRIAGLYRQAYGENRAVVAKVQREKELVKTVTEQLEAIEARSFPDLDEVNLLNLKLQVGSQRTRMYEAVSEGREKGYRELARGQQDVLARCAVAAARFQSLVEWHKASIEGMVNSGIATVDGLGLHLSSFTSHATPVLDETHNIFANVTRSDALPPAPVRTPLKGASLRMVPVGNGPAAAAPVSPRVQRVVSSVEKSGGYAVGKLNSPRRPIPPRALRRSSAMPTKARFADEDGQVLKTVHSYQPRSSQSPSFDLANGDDSADWEEVDDVKQVKSGPRASLSTVPAPFEVTGSPSPPPGPVQDEAIPEWKRNRMLMGKAAVADGGDAADTSVSKAPAIGLGKPSQRLRPGSSGGPLSELKQLPARSSLASSTLMQPTAASAAKAALHDKTASPSSDASPSSADSRRRLSLRHERSKLHRGAVPYSRKLSMIPSPVSSPNGTTISPRDRKRTSTGPADGSSGSSAPRLRHSMSMSIGPSSGTTGLKHRPSMVGLGGSNLPRWR